MHESLFGQILLKFHQVSEEQLRAALEFKRSTRSNLFLGEILVQRGVIDERTVRTILTVQQRQRAQSIEAPDAEHHELAERLRGAPLAAYLKVAREKQATDLVLSSGRVPALRLNGALEPLPCDKLTTESCWTLIESALPSAMSGDLKRALESRQRFEDLDVQVSEPRAGRFRLNVFSHEEGIAAVFRAISERAWKFEDLGLPSVVQELVDLRSGLVLITGPTGSGKSTTLASLLELINQKRRAHIITIEDPIEVLHVSKLSVFSQREVPTHTAGFASALRAALREDPDVIVVGEIRDPETLAIAMSAAETGHLVFATLHSRIAVRTILRVLDTYPSPRKDAVRKIVANVLRAVISQQLLPDINGERLHMVCDLMLVNRAIANLIREGRLWQIPGIMQVSRREGMQLVDDQIESLRVAGKVSVEEALARATDRNRFLTPVEPLAAGSPREGARR